MFERVQKPFLTIETGEAYQPIRLTYRVVKQEKLVAQLNGLRCLQAGASSHTWSWEWKDECNDIHFESMSTFKKQAASTIRLGTLTLSGQHLYINLPSFKRACLAVSFFHQHIDPAIASVHSADFINKVFGFDEPLPHGFNEVFKEDELKSILNQRVKDYGVIKEKCEQAASPEEAFSILSQYTATESEKRLPFAERYEFEVDLLSDPEITFLSFYIFLRARELVAIRRWFGDAHYSLSDAADETVESVFGEMGIDLIE